MLESMGSSAGLELVGSSSTMLESMGSSAGPGSVGSSSTVLESMGSSAGLSSDGTDAGSFMKESRIPLETSCWNHPSWAGRILPSRSVFGVGYSPSCLSSQALPVFSL